MSKSDIKYTDDGRKVKVVGNLNSQEKIVQEIFVTDDGNEIPSGENFVVKSLHDQPSLSWKEKKMQQIEESYDSYRKKVDRERKRLRSRHEEVKTELKSKISYLRKVMEALPDLAFDQMEMLLLDEIQYVVKLSFRPEIIAWEEFQTLDRYNQSGIKLFTLFGKDEGTMDWRISEYKDGSGTRTTIVPCRSYEDAVDVLKDHVLQRIEERGVSDHALSAAKEHEFDLPADAVMEYYDKQVKSRKERAQKLANDLKEAEEKLRESENMLSELENTEES